MSELLDLAHSIADTKERLRQAFENKGVSCDPWVAFEEYPDKVNQIKGEPNLTELFVDTNGEYFPDGSDGFSKVIVEIESQGSGNLQEKTIYNNGTHLPDEGFDGFSKVDVQVSSADPTYTFAADYYSDELDVGDKVLVRFNKANVSNNEVSSVEVYPWEVYFDRKDSEDLYSAIITEKDGGNLKLRAYLGDIINLTIDTTDYDSVVVRGVSL